ncbi:hypothetical protein AXG93_2923s1020 [Marchantia polymorpha subsp. ruderalis]|uniref:Uncharacterized protein n=1 Tax=Marchantia polymorpha subsp. ruderalis TaxID=1480154 RepID=A0A176W1B1_MARPO|nr:hypothetical protein AXG93_2923s1020 [Marchantia polymorpha subsp. ruderalis]
MWQGIYNHAFCFTNFGTLHQILSGMEGIGAMSNLKLIALISIVVLVFTSTTFLVEKVGAVDQDPLLGFSRNATRSTVRRICGGARAALDIENFSGLIAMNTIDDHFRFQHRPCSCRRCISLTTRRSANHPHRIHEGLERNRVDFRTPGANAGAEGVRVVGSIL